VSFENHIATCPECSAMVSEIRTIWTSLDTLPVIDQPESLVGRINAALDEQEAEETKQTFSRWRSLASARSLAYAASIAAIAMLGMGGLHVTRASLDPLGSIIKLLHPAPAITVALGVSRAEWTPNEQGSGTLTVHLKAQPESDGRIAHVHCVVNVPAEDLQTSAATDADIASDTETSITIPLKTPPTASAISVTISAPPGLGSTLTKTEPVTMMEPIAPPADH